MAYLSEHFYKLMKQIPNSQGKTTALRVSYQRERIKDGGLDEENFIENGARPNIQKVLDEEVKKMIDDSFKDINVILHVWK